MKKIIIVLVIFAGLVLGSIYFLNRLLFVKQSYLAEKKPMLIGLAIGAIHEERWAKDQAFFVQRAEELGATVSVALSDQDVTQQISQIENLISQGASVIVIVAADSEKLSPAITKAKQDGVKIMAYDRLIKDSDIDLYISFDNIKVGEMEAESVLSVASHGNFAYIGGAPTDNNAFLLKNGSMNILSPKIKSGAVKLVIDKFMTDWKPEEAYKTIRDYLNSGNTLDAVIAANDGTASGVIQALKEKGLDGKIPVSGQDAELSATQRIMAGTQTSTIYKPIKSLAYTAAEIAVAMANGQTPETTDFIDNGKIRVPAYFLLPVSVNKSNMLDTVVKDGFHTYEEVYKLKK